MEVQQIWFLCFQTATSSPHPHMAFALCVATPGVSSSADKDTNPISSGPHTLTSFNLKYVPKDPVSKYSHTPRYWELEHQRMTIREGDTVQS